ncbi:hypothetical protein D3C84_1050740 [compost metagenome]
MHLEQVSDAAYEYGCFSRSSTSKCEQRAFEMAHCLNLSFIQQDAVLLQIAKKISVRIRIGYEPCAIGKQRHFCMGDRAIYSWFSA